MIQVNGAGSKIHGFIRAVIAATSVDFITDSLRQNRTVRTWKIWNASVHGGRNLRGHSHLRQPGMESHEP